MSKVQTSKVGQKAYVVTTNKMIGNAVIVRDYEQEHIDFLARGSPHPSESQPVTDIEYDVKQQLDKIYNAPPPKFKEFLPTQTSARRASSRPSSSKSAKSNKNRPSSSKQMSTTSNGRSSKNLGMGAPPGMPPPAPVRVRPKREEKREEEESKNIEIEQPGNRRGGGSEEEDSDDYGDDDDYEDDDDFESEVASTAASTAGAPSLPAPSSAGMDDEEQSPIHAALADITEALNSGTVKESRIKSFLVASREVRGLVIRREKTASRVLTAVTALAEEGAEEARSVLNEGGMAVLALVVDATFKVDDARLQLEALQCMLQVAQSFGVQKKDAVIRDLEMEFIMQTLFNTFRVVAESESDLLRAQEVACRLLRYLAGNGGARAIARLHENKGFDGMRYLIEVLERPGTQGKLQCLASSSVLSLIVHSPSNASYVNNYSGQNGNSGTTVVASAIEAYAHDSDVQALAAPATQQLFQNSRVVYGHKYDDDEDRMSYNSSSFGGMSRPQTASHSRPHTASTMGKALRDRKPEIEPYRPGQWGAPSMETLTREYKEVVRTIAGIRHSDTRGRRDGRGLSGDAMNAINRCEARKKYLLNQIRMLELDKTYKLRALSRRRKRNSKSMPALHAVTSPQNPYISHGKKKRNRKRNAGHQPVSPSRGPIDDVTGMPPTIESVERTVQRKFKERYSPPKDAQWFTGNFAKDVQKLKTKLGIDSGLAARNTISRSRARANPLSPSLSKAVQPDPGLEPPKWNSAKDQSEIEVAIAMMDRTSVPEESPYADIPKFINWTEREFKPVIDAPGLRIVPSPSKRRPNTAGTRQRGGKRRPRRVRPMTSTGAVRRSGSASSVLRKESRSSRPVSSPLVRKVTTQEMSMSRIAERRKNSSGIGRPQTASAVRRDHGMQPAASAPALRTGNVGLLEGIDGSIGPDEQKDVTTVTHTINQQNFIMVPNPASYRPSTAPTTRKTRTKTAATKKPRRRKKKKPKKAPVVTGEPKPPSKLYKRRKRQNHTFSKSVKRRAKSKIEKEEEAAALKIQCIARGKMARKGVEQKKQEIHSAKQIQKLARARTARQKVAQKRKERDSAKRIQALHRGKVDRKRVVKLKEEKVAAEKIQSVARAKRDRKRVNKIREEKKAAEGIQRLARGNAARARVEKLREERRKKAEEARFKAEQLAAELAEAEQQAAEAAAAAEVEKLKAEQLASGGEAPTAESSSSEPKLEQQTSALSALVHEEDSLTESLKAGGRINSIAETAEDTGEVSLAPSAEQWIQYYTEDDNTPYWYNTVTGESRWSDPNLSLNASGDALSQAESGQTEAAEARAEVLTTLHYDVAQIKKEQSESAPALPPPASSEAGKSEDSFMHSVGDAVMASAPTWSSKYPGVVASVNSDGTYNISFDDGDYQENIPGENVEKRASAGSPEPKEETTPKPTQLFNTGAYVKATTLEWDEWYPGRIVQFDANSGCYSVLFDDGESRDDVTEGNMKEYNPAGDARQDVAIAIDGEKKKLQKELQSLDDNYQYDFDEFENENTPQKVVQTKAENSTNWFDADEEDEESSASSSEDDGGF